VDHPSLQFPQAITTKDSDNGTRRIPQAVHRRNYILQGGVGWDGGLLGGNNQNGYLASRNVFVDPANWNYTLVPSLTAASKDFPGGGGDTTGTADCGYNHAYLIAMLGDIGD